jgi:hypothetical protein
MQQLQREFVILDTSFFTVSTAFDVPPEPFAEACSQVQEQGTHEMTKHLDPQEAVIWI